MSSKKIEELFAKNKLAGEFKPEYKEYQKFFTKIKEVNHQSSLILISQEQCVQMLNEYSELDGIELGGLNTIECLKNLGLKDENSWLELINLYDGNLVYLRYIAYTIKKIYGGKVREFIAENSLLTKEIESHCAEIFKRLSPVDFRNGLLSLQQRYLVKSREENEQTLFYLTPVFQAYLQNCG